MAKDFFDSVCAPFVTDLTRRGYEAHGCHFVRQVEGLRGTVWLVEGVSSLSGYFMPRLAVGIPALGEDVAVLSRDLHQLAHPDRRGSWYAWKADETSLAKAREDLVAKGLPWLDKHLSIAILVDALEQERDRPPTRSKSSWWSLGTRDTEQAASPVRLNVLQFLSYAYELQGRPEAALATWRGYIAGHRQLQKGSSLERMLNERLAALDGQAKASGHST
jgi:hypothetical protein